jgi:hypothetical protein
MLGNLFLRFSILLSSLSIYNSFLPSSFSDSLTRDHEDFTLVFPSSIEMLCLLYILLFCVYMAASNRFSISKALCYVDKSSKERTFSADE